ncbi:tripeptidyl-peptidase [Podospora conica]|nr:tripeptidyl-peptidase [Schizothecium conicum]
MWLRLPLALLGLAAVHVHAASTVLLEKAEGLSPGWIYRGQANASETITLSIVLKEPGMDDIKDKLLRRHSNPRHPDFNSPHLTREEVRRARQPRRKAVSEVSAWLKSNGIGEMQTRGSLITFTATAKTVKTLFQADLGRYEYKDDSTNVLRALNYTVPAWLRSDIDFVHPLANFMVPHRKPPKPQPQPTKGNGKSCKASSGTTKSVSTKAASTKSGANTSKTASTLKTVSTSKTASTLKTVSTSKTASTSKTDSSVVDNPTLSTSDVPFATLTVFPGGPSPGDYPCSTGTYPECIRQLYNISYEASAPSPVRFGVPGFLEQWIHHADVEKFMYWNSPELLALDPPHNFTVQLFNDGINPQDSYGGSGMEAALDVQYAITLSYPANVIYYVTGGRGIKFDAEGVPHPEEISDNEPFLEFLTELLAQPDDQIPHVLSISYADDEVGVPVAYARRVCDLFAAAAARGVTTFVATGDGGASGTGQLLCASKERNPRKMYMPTFPASCPYVTSVGATHNMGPPLMGAEFSTGGFSTFFPRPDFQREVVDPFVDAMVARNDSRLPLIARNGRAMPDISAIGSGFEIVRAGAPNVVLGTSASTPVVASMIALVNDARLRAGKPSLGWFNPVLYSEKVRATLTDVTVGNSRGCVFPDRRTAPGWPSLEGYDCVTGLGVVGDFSEFMAALV